MTITAGQLLARILAVNGVDTVYGRPLAGVDVTPVADPAVADLLAAAHRRVHRSGAAVHCGDGRLVTAPDAPERVIRDAAELLDPLPSAFSLLLHLDLDGPAPDRVPAPAPVADRWLDPEPDDLQRLEGAVSPTMLVGPGIVAAGAVAALNAFATAGDVGVLNTWGAKGVFHWRSRHHFATVGMQAEDYRLGGLATADLIVASGVDADEAPADRWRLAPVLTVDPGALGPLSERWRRPRGALTVPPLRAGLAAATQDGWTAHAAPLPPSKVTLHYGHVFGTGGLVAADAGIAGYWVARTFGTTELGSAQVPARPAPGFAAACALVARLRSPRRPVLAAVDELDASVGAVLDAASSLDVAVPVEVWDPDGDAIDADSHLDRLRRLAVAGAPAPVTLRTDGRQLDRMIAVAGPIVAWGGLAC